MNSGFDVNMGRSSGPRWGDDGAGQFRLFGGIGTAIP